MALLYLDASALVKLVRDEPESAALDRFVAEADLVSCSLAHAEVPRALRRHAAADARVDLSDDLRRCAAVIATCALIDLELEVLVMAGALPEPGLRSLDAIHVAAATAVAPVDAFVTYDVRQAAAARLAGLRTVAPGTLTSP